ncbi:acyl carrier protein [Vibrio coralliilyticus]|uniref:Carrier domain-containing protein n=1 Tax=Vibrio coralliilyticus TaxID=190893 RepID=A0AAN0SD50_9VIBR|nr:acyl carrier protein [Vibrio coralliilyticus]AIW20299.1 hypothetical protein IX92_15215 [Vibrio coralliilyticus]MCG9679279.1 acyl carrier protein [Vibrio sp. Isolate24]NOH38573.1 acyl carrier protein [Vibrio coralliilyticus]
MDVKLSTILSSVFGVQASEISASLTKADLQSWDSLKQMDLVTTLEREYSITLELMDIVSMTSVEAIMGVLRDKGVELES